MRKVTDLKRDEVIVVNTKEEALFICGLMHDAGLRWINGNSYKDKTNFKGEPIYYRPFIGAFGSLQLAHGDYKMIPALEFMQKFVGYRLLFPEYAKAVLNIEGHRYIGNAVATGQILKASAIESIEKLGDAGVLDLWFEKVYERPYRVGDHIIITRYQCGDPVGTVTTITEVLSDDLVMVEAIGYSTTSSFRANKPYFRHATPEEVLQYEKSSKLPTINGHEGKVKGDHIVWGCTSIAMESLREILQHCSSIKLKNGSVTLTREDIRRIERIINLNLEK